MARTTQIGYLRQLGSTKRIGGSNPKGATAAVFLAGIQFTFDPTQASATTGAFLPKGAIPILSNVAIGGATGGASPTVDLGSAGDAAGFGNEIAADDNTDLQSTGGDMGAELTVDTEIFAGVGASAATGGSVTAVIYYIMSDDGKA